MEFGKSENPVPHCSTLGVCNRCGSERNWKLKAKPVCARLVAALINLVCTQEILGRRGPNGGAAACGTHSGPSHAQPNVYGTVGTGDYSAARTVYFTLATMKGL